MSKLAVIGVMGSSENAHEDLAAPLGRLLARLPVHLLTGGGQAAMAAVSRAFVESESRKGLCIGVIPAETLEHPTHTRAGYPNDWVELAIRTHLVAKHPDAWDGLTRNHINILSSDVVIALPGSRGTAHEIDLAVKYGKPVAAYFHREDEMENVPEVVSQCTAITQVEAFLDAQLAAHAPAA